MKAIYLTKQGDLDVLKIQDCPKPDPEPNEIRIRVHAAGINFADIMIRQGYYSIAPKYPCILGYEVAGTVDAVGSEVLDFNIGDRVFALTQFGGHAEFVCAFHFNAAHMFPEATYEEAAAIPVSYLTAYLMLFNNAHLKSGDRILIQAAASSAGIAALQLCATIPHVTTFGTASAAKHPIIKAQGCHFPIDYHTQDYVKEIKQCTHQYGVDIVLDPLGGADSMKGYELLSRGGRLVVFGFSNLASSEKRNLRTFIKQVLKIPKFDPIKLMNDNRSVCGFHLGYLGNEPILVGNALREIAKLYEKGMIKPRIDSVFSFQDVKKAYQRVHQRKNIGKIILTPL